MSDGREPLLRAIGDIARRAGAEILDVYRSKDLGATAKADRSPLTLADLRAHEVIAQALGSLMPDIPILSEEGASIPFEVRATWQRHWLVDPLDGTKEFVRGNGEFTVNIALIAGHEAQLGVVYVPVTETLYSGGPGLGAWRQVGAGPATEIRVQAQASAPLRVIGSKSHRGNTLDALLAKLGPHVFVPVGSALKFCLVAEGAADFYPRLGPTSEWDTAAAHAVVVGAGGTVIETSGAPLRYNARRDLVNPHFLVFGDRSRNWLGLLA
ncbi:MAG TPA: 3'(2'),5'-bisphosphate nucleotidase CysQ [Steroidobacteraceae bacterium]|nr:3'(2'),5'-bisphosphate nucleotidase CysQ [Steroidobacteraceae bacterium]